MTRRDERGGRDRPEAESEEEQYLRDIGYRPNLNQVRHEPIPASDHSERGQLGELRNEEAAEEAAAHQRRKSHEQSPPGGKPNG